MHYDRRVPQAHDVTALPGRGLQAKVNDQTLSLGSSRLLRELGGDPAGLADEAATLEAQGRTVSWLVRNGANGANGANNANNVDRGQLLGLLAFGDTVKASAREAIARLHQLGVKTVMLTGDNRGSAQAVTEQCQRGRQRVVAEALAFVGAALGRDAICACANGEPSRSLTQKPRRTRGAGDEHRASRQGKWCLGEDDPPLRAGWSAAGSRTNRRRLPPIPGE